MSSRKDECELYAFSFIGEPREASGWLCALKTTHQPLDIRRHLAPAHDNRPELKGRCRDDRIGESHRLEVVMQVGPMPAMEGVA